MSYLAGFDKKRSKSLRLIEYLVTGEESAAKAIQNLADQEANIDVGGSLKSGVKLVAIDRVGMWEKRRKVDGGVRDLLRLAYGLRRSG